MFELVKAGGWLMLPIILCSVVALAIIFERFWSLKTDKIIPDQLVTKVWHWVQQNQMTAERLRDLREGSPLGEILAVGIVNANQDRAIMKDSIEDTGRHVVIRLEKFLNTLGTIAAISPLLGLLGTVVGMIQVFSVMTSVGVGDPGQLAGGISKALITTAAGITVAIPSLFFYRYFRGRVDELVIDMEQEALKLVDAFHGTASSELKKKKK
ncbi:MAG TPA: MotA/TolQ/ExbB proton channel family protein [Gammaproteobacteria bacterium]|nr:MotA/TolQ/ExbB proton channel family protein [Gammaproteobacteria bacterium]